MKKILFCFVMFGTTLSAMEQSSDQQNDRDLLGNKISVLKDDGTGMCVVHDLMRYGEGGAPIYCPLKPGEKPLFDFDAQRNKSSVAMRTVRGLLEAIEKGASTEKLLCKLRDAKPPLDILRNGGEGNYSAQALGRLGMLLASISQDSDPELPRALDSLKAAIKDPSLPPECKREFRKGRKQCEKRLGMKPVKKKKEKKVVLKPEPWTVVDMRDAFEEGAKKSTKPVQNCISVPNGLPPKKHEIKPKSKTKLSPVLLNTKDIKRCRTKKKKKDERGGDNSLSEKECMWNEIIAGDKYYCHQIMMKLLGRKGEESFKEAAEVLRGRDSFVIKDPIARKRAVRYFGVEYPEKSRQAEKNGVVLDEQKTWPPMEEVLLEEYARGRFLFENCTVAHELDKNGAVYERIHADGITGTCSPYEMIGSAAMVGHVPSMVYLATSDKTGLSYIKRMQYLMQITEMGKQVKDGEKKRVWRSIDTFAQEGHFAPIIMGLHRAYERRKLSEYLDQLEDHFPQIDIYGFDADQVRVMIQKRKKFWDTMPEDVRERWSMRAIRAAIQISSDFCTVVAAKNEAKRKKEEGEEKGLVIDLDSLQETMKEQFYILQDLHEEHEELRGLLANCCAMCGVAYDGGEQEQFAFAHARDYAPESEAVLTLCIARAFEKLSPEDLEENKELYLEMINDLMNCATYYKPHSFLFAADFHQKMGDLDRASSLLQSAKLAIARTRQEADLGSFRDRIWHDIQLQNGQKTGKRRVVQTRTSVQDIEKYRKIGITNAIGSAELLAKGDPLRALEFLKTTEALQVVLSQDEGLKTRYERVLDQIEKESGMHKDHERIQEMLVEIRAGDVRVNGKMEEGPVEDVERQATAHVTAIDFALQEAKKVIDVGDPMEALRLLCDCAKHHHMFSFFKMKPEWCGAYTAIMEKILPDEQVDVPEEIIEQLRVLDAWQEKAEQLCDHKNKTYTLDLSVNCPDKDAND